MKTQSIIKILTITGLAVGLGAPLLRAADADQPGQLNSGDYKFVSGAARGGLMEVQVGELAKAKATGQRVRDFADKIVKDHSKANDELKQLAATKQTALPAQISTREQSSIDRLQTLSGPDFDKAFIADAVKDHKKDVKEFQEAAKSAADPDVRAFAQKMLPTLEEHLRMAQDLEGQIKNTP
jgi:putative membrane protein